MTAMPSVSYERTVFYRERAASMYSSAPYSMAMALVEVDHYSTFTTCCDLYHTLGRSKALAIRNL